MDEQNPTGGDTGASTPDPIDRLEAFLAAQDGDSTQDDGDDDPAQAEKTEQPENDAQDDKQPPITTAQLAQFLGVDESAIDVDEDGAPVFKGKVDGKEQKAKFADLVKTYQLQAHAENRVREAAAKEQAAERRLQEADQAIQAKLQEQQQSLANTAQLAAVLQEELKGEYQSINWDELWQTNPAQARSIERRFEQRQQRINGVFQQIQARTAQAQQQAVQMRQAAAEQNDRRQREQLLKLVPEWSDQATFAKERVEILQWVEKSGVDPQDLDLSKASQVALLRRAWQHDTLQQSKPAVEKQVRAAPKLVKPGTSQQADTTNTAMLKSLKQQVKQTGGRGSKALEQYLLAAGKA